ncbi:TPR-like protein [Martensiomyces pterosporus]|nr:TPR-like protein [Martensiomyces pterosporus]
MAKALATHAAVPVPWLCHAVRPVVASVAHRCYLKGRYIRVNRLPTNRHPSEHALHVVPPMSSDGPSNKHKAPIFWRGQCPNGCALLQTIAALFLRRHKRLYTAFFNKLYTHIVFVAMESSSLKLAQGFAKDAQKASKGGWLSKPEWDLAAQYWDKAATAFKAARRFEEAADCYAKASGAYVKINAVYLAAKCFENAGMLAEQQLRNHASAIEYYCRASDLYLSHGSSADKAAELMEKAAKSCENIDVNRAIQLHNSALSIYENEDRGRFGIESFKRATRYMIEKSLFTQAIETQHRLAAICEQIGNQSERNKCYLSIIVIALAFGDEVEAGKRMNAFAQDDSFMRSHEALAADGILQAYASGDQDGFARCAEDQTLSFLESSVARLARKIRVPGSRHPAMQPQDTASAPKSGLHPNAKSAADISSTSALPLANNSGSGPVGRLAEESDDYDDLL